MDRLARRVFGSRDFGPELDAAAEDTAVVDVSVDGRVFEVGSGVGLSGMGCERASVLCCGIAGEVVAEVVVLILVVRDGEVVVDGGEIDGCSYALILLG